MLRFSSLLLVSLGLLALSPLATTEVLARSVSTQFASLSSVKSLQRSVSRLEAQLEQVQEQLQALQSDSVVDDQQDEAAPTPVAQFASASVSDFSFPNPLHINPPTVPALNVQAYLGAWYEMYADAVVLDTFQRNSYCAQAHYALLPNGKVGVYNSQTVGSAAGTYGDIMGTATTTDAPGKLTVSLQGGAPFPADYWVLALGPINANGLYDYAIVSDRLEATLFVLARDPTVFASQYQTDVLAQLKTLGFDKFYNNPQAIQQGAGCVYATDAQVQNAFDILTKQNQ